MPQNNFQGQQKRQLYGQNPSLLPLEPHSEDRWWEKAQDQGYPLDKTFQNEEYWPEDPPPYQEDPPRYPPSQGQGVYSTGIRTRGGQKQEQHRYESDDSWRREGSSHQSSEKAAPREAEPSVGNPSAYPPSTSGGKYMYSLSASTLAKPKFMWRAPKVSVWHPPKVSFSDGYRGSNEYYDFSVTVVEHEFPEDNYRDPHIQPYQDWVEQSPECWHNGTGAVQGGPNEMLPSNWNTDGAPKDYHRYGY